MRKRFWSKKGRRQALWPLLGLSPMLLVEGPLSMAGEADVIVENLQRKYEATADFVADFRQETEIKTLNRVIKASGKVHFKRPGKMLWRYDEPKGQFLLADGKNFYFYQPEQRQVVKGALRSAFHSDIPLSFLLGIGNLKRDFQVSSKGVEQGHYVLRLVPKAEFSGVSELVLGVESQGFDILWARIQDTVGNTTTVRFSRIQRGVGLKDSLFVLQVPDGADVVELSPPPTP